MRSGMLQVPDIRQKDLHDCGVAVCASVCEFFSISLSFSEIERRLKTSEDGTHPGAILTLFTQLGLSTVSGCYWGVRTLAQWTSHGVPVLCPIQVGELSEVGSGHWVIVLGAGLGQVVVQDPAYGRWVYPQTEWLNRWHDCDKDGVEYPRYGMAMIGR